MKSTQELVRDALRDEDARKRRKVDAKRLEDDDDGRDDIAAPSSGAGPSTSSADPEARIGEAKKRRKMARHGGGLVETAEDLELGDVREAEEEDLGGGGGGDDDGDDGDQHQHQQFTAFNLNDERATGRFDRDGNYYWNDERDKDRDKDKEDDVEDAWLKSVEVLDKASAERARRASERQRAEDAEDDPAGPSERQIAAMNIEIADLLREGETVRAALIRLGGKPQKKQKHRRRKDRGLPPGLREPKSEECAEDPEAEARRKSDLAELTALSTDLLNVGDLDVYSKKKEDFERSASLFLGRNGAAQGAPAQAQDENEEDMFAEEDATADDGAKAGPKAAPAPREVAEDYASWSISRLKAFLERRGEDLRGVAEKCDLVDRVRRRADLESRAPPGYVLDPQSSYYVNHKKRVYFDPVSRHFFDGSKWVKDEPNPL